MLALRRAPSVRWAALSIAAALAPVRAAGQEAPPGAMPPPGAPAVVTFCAGAEALPMSSAPGSPPGYDVEIARALARAMGAEARFVWLDAGESFEGAVRDGRCDAAPGVVAGEAPLTPAPPLAGLVLTRPYHATGYLLLRRPDSPPLRTLDEAGSTRIAVEGESVATYTLRQQGRKVHVLFDADAVIRAVAEGRARYGYLWGPIAAWLIRGRDDVVFAPEFEPRDRWRFAFAVRAGDGELRARLDEAIAALVADGTIEAICRRYGLPGCAVEGR